MYGGDGVYAELGFIFLLFLSSFKKLVSPQQGLDCSGFIDSIVRIYINSFY